MSADNGIYILETPTVIGEGFEYRVADLGAIENLYYNCDWSINHVEETDNPDDHIRNARERWKGCSVFLTKAEAYMEADMLLQSTYICEYGISILSIDRVF